MTAEAKRVIPATPTDEREIRVAWVWPVINVTARRGAALRQSPRGTQVRAAKRSSASQIPAGRHVQGNGPVVQRFFAGGWNTGHASCVLAGCGQLGAASASGLCRRSRKRFPTRSSREISLFWLRCSAILWLSWAFIELRGRRWVDASRLCVSGRAAVRRVLGVEP